MIYFKPCIKLSRLIAVGKNGRIVYDEKFNSKLNIIRGSNSSGKSTIANFIFYALGGEFHNWTTQAANCDSVYAELVINETVVTIKRLITQHSSQPMYIFWGPYENVIQNRNEGWEVYPYKMSDKQRSFSNVLFSLLGLPELKGDYDSNITINQLLRLMYIDQKSPTMSLFKYELFDSPLTRRTIAELLFGVYDNYLYYSRLKLRNLSKDYDDKKKQVDGILYLYESIGNDINIEQVEHDIVSTEEELVDIQKKILSTRSKEVITIDSRKKLSYDNLQDNLTKQKKRYFELLEQIKKYEYDIEDSNYFIDALIKRKNALQDSTETRNSFGNIKLAHCPNCLSPLTETTTDNICFLCKTPLQNEESQSILIRMRVELENQILESQRLLHSKNEQLSELKSNISTESEKLKHFQRNIDEILEEVKSTRNKEIDELFTQKGQLGSKLEFLVKELKAAQQIGVLKKDLINLENAISNTKKTIEAIEVQQRQKYIQALLTIEKYTLKILKRDLDRQNEFKYGNKIDLDFVRDTFALDEKNNFSESSNTFLKNAVRFGIFFASLELDFFRYPRFILCDNVEDKGMEEIRSQNFQKVINEISNQFEVDHQIILTTSMINPELNNKNICIGSEYSSTNKSLIFSV